MINWIRRIMTREIKSIKTIDELDDFVEKNNLTILSLFPNDSYTDEENSFENVSRKVIDVEFSISKSNTVLQYFYSETEPRILAYQKERSKTVMYSGSLTDESSLERFVNDSVRPSVWRFDAEVSSKIFDIDRPIILLLRLEAHPLTGKLDDALHKASSILAHKVSLVKAGYYTPEEERLVQYIGAKVTDFPCLYVIKLFDGGFHKFRKFIDESFFDDPLAPAAIIEFYDNVESGAVDPFYRSEDAPTQSGDVEVIVASTFESLVLQRNMSVLLELHAPWCSHCREFQPIYEQVAVELKKKYPNRLAVAKIDGTANDLKEIVAVAYPTILFFRLSDKKSPLVFEDLRNAQALIKFVDNIMSKETSSSPATASVALDPNNSENHLISESQFKTEPDELKVKSSNHFSTGTPYDKFPSDTLSKHEEL
eukprot:GHVL01010886.1.p1 GENE.GHVL01010886.1~~GHVL01010886.1.p1  ORF type:complete len:425 (+),score=59.38 GHVL01010886.1:404-1678(+)